MWRLFKYFLFFLFTFGLINSFFNSRSNIFAIILSTIYALIIAIGFYRFKSNIDINNKSPPSLNQKIISLTKSFIKFIFSIFVFTCFGIIIYNTHERYRERAEVFAYAAALQEACIANNKCVLISPPKGMRIPQLTEEKFSFFIPEWLNGTSIEGGLNKTLTAVIHRSSSREDCIYSLETKNWSCHKDENGR